MSKLKNKQGVVSPFEWIQVKEFIRCLEKELAGSKPGPDAHLTMITNPRPGHRVYHEVEESCHKAGVLVLFYAWEGRLHLVLTRRTEGVDFHKGQISFPGGRQEKEEIAEQTAIREAQEELNIDPETIRILGRLTPLYIPPSNYCIYPIVGFCEVRPDFRPFRLEVAEVLEIPLDHFLDSQAIQRERWFISGVELEVPFYAFGEHKIWGATAMVLAELLEIIKETSLFCPP